MCKLTNLRQRYQTDGACIEEDGIHFKMVGTGTQLEDLSLGVCSSRVSVGNNIHELHNCYQQGGTMTESFSRLASYVLSTGVDQTDFVGGPGFKLELGYIGHELSWCVSLVACLVAD
jgi:hypothetical protein